MTSSFSGKVIWKTYTIPEEPKPAGTSSAGTPQFAPAGAAVWSAPTIDPSTNSIYIATGDAYTQPAATTSDAVMALDMTTGAVKWVQQVTKGDAYTIPDQRLVGQPDSPPVEQVRLRLSLDGVPFELVRPVHYR